MKLVIIYFISSSMKNNTKSDSSKQAPSESPRNRHTNRKPRHTKSQRHRDKVKPDKCSVAVAQVKEDSHKKHPKMDYITEAVNAKLKEFETPCPQ